MATAIDLFAGCGGTSQGLTDAGYTVLAAVEINDKPIKVFKANFETTKVLKRDLFSYTPSELMFDVGIRPGQLDLLAGCPPCQSFSSMRTRNGSISPRDKRSDLVETFSQFVIELEPQSFAFENVPGLIHREELTKVIDRLRLAGYGIDLDVINAANFGVAQRRKRLVVIGAKDKAVKLIRDSGLRSDVRTAIGHLPNAGTSLDYAHDLPERRTERIKALIQLIPKDGGSRTDLPEDFILPCHKRYPKGFKDVYGRMSWRKVAPTITGGCASPSKGRFLHPEYDRCITMREALILQGFPEDYIIPDDLSKTDIALMVGNAFPPAMIKHQARALKEATC